MALLFLVGIFIIVPIAELYVIIKVGEAIGALPTIAILIADAILGAFLLRHQASSAWRRFNQTLAAGRMPQREILDGIAIIFGGAFLITPGFISDFIGLLFLIPPTRALLMRFVVKRFSKRMSVHIATPGPGFQTGQAWDVEGTATEVHPDDQERLGR